MAKKKTTVRLGLGDSALIFREDGTYELHLPEEQTPDELPQAGCNAMRCAVFICCDDLVDTVDIRAKRILDKKCPICNIDLVEGKAILNTLVPGVPDFPGSDPCGDGQTLNYGGPGKLVGCWKCPQCGLSRK